MLDALYRWLSRSPEPPHPGPASALLRRMADNEGWIGENAACRDMEALRHAEQNGFVRLDSQNGYFLTRKGKQVAKRWKL